MLELEQRPEFEVGQMVRTRRLVRNDGTFPGMPLGAMLVQEGEQGYVASIGTFLQRYYIYGVDFYERGYVVGMRAEELKLVTIPKLLAD